MAGNERTSFFGLIILFLMRQPTVWIGGLATALATLLGMTDLGPGAGGAAVLAVLVISVVASVVLDRRRGVGRRVLLRGRRVSIRRITALVIALVLVGGTAAFITSNFVRSMQTVAAEDVRRQSTPDKKRGWY
jgi:hypothetical protein